MHEKILSATLKRNNLSFVRTSSRMLLHTYKRRFESFTMDVSNCEFTVNGSLLSLA